MIFEKFHDENLKKKIYVTTLFKTKRQEQSQQCVDKTTFKSIKILFVVNMFFNDQFFV